MTVVIRVSDTAERLVWNWAAYPGVELLDLPILREGTTPSGLLWSLAASPGRYVEAALMRAKRLSVKGAVAVLNPAVPVEPRFWPDLTGFLRACASTGQACVLATLEDTPLAYYLPAHLFQALDDARAAGLRFLSCISGALDGELLSRVVNSAVSLVPTSHQGRVSEASGFALAGFEMLYRHMALRAIQWLTAGGSSFGASPQPVVAYLPYHAGDLLFFLQAWKSVRHPFTHVIVNRAYLDIARLMLPSTQLIVLEASPMYRPQAGDDSVKKYDLEPEYFFDVANRHIPPTAAVYFFRPMRRYDRARYHLADQWRFSLSNDLYPLVAEQVEAPPPARKAMGRSVLLHFEGGWSLKIYPRAAQRELVQRLLDMGFAVTVASGEDLGIACRKVRIGGVEHLKETLAAHAIFVGMDSFPTHYAVHVAKHPTLCLFASTQPQNSDAPPSAFYQALHRGLSCVPCSSATICPAFGGTECRNFTPPDEVARHVGELYTSSYLGAA